MPTVLNAGSGPIEHALPRRFEGWQELRIDNNPDMRPDIVAPMTSMQMVESDSVDAVWCSHALEHLEAHETELALLEFWRVLRAGGDIIVSVPDLTQVAAAILATGLEATLYVSSMGPITALDVLYGHEREIRGGNRNQAHRTGFTGTSLDVRLTRAGFVEIRVAVEFLGLCATAKKPIRYATKS
jgi:SAM-dependent methyltransferase